MEDGICNWVKEHHKNSPLDSILSQVNLVYMYILLHLRSIVILSSDLCLGLPDGLFPSGFLTAFKKSQGFVCRNTDFEVL